MDTANAAKLRVHLEYKNVGTASAENVSPHFNIRLGNKIINTVKATQDRYKANYLSTEKGGRNKTEVVIDSLEGQADANIVLSLDELKAVEQGNFSRLKFYLQVQWIYLLKKVKKLCIWGFREI